MRWKSVTRSFKKTALLLWKNALLIFRRPVSFLECSSVRFPFFCLSSQVSLVSEILIPMKLYIALLILRSVFPPDYYQDRELIVMRVS